MKWSKVLKQLMNSVSGRVILTILVMVLPLNILAFFAASQAMTKVEEYAVLLEQSIADSYMSDLAVKMDNSISLLYYLQTEDSNSIRMLLQPEDDYQYMSSKMKCFYATKHMANLIPGGEGYFFYMKRKDDFMIYNGSSENGIFLDWFQSGVKESIRSDSKKRMEADGVRRSAVSVAAD